MNRSWRIVAVLIVALVTAALAHAASQPRAAKSEYLITTGAGFVMTPEEGVRYGMNFAVRKKSPSTLYLKVLFENPEDAAAPLRTDQVLAPDVTEFIAQSPPLTVVRHDTRYKVEVLIYADEARSQLLGTHRQEVLFSVPPELEAHIEREYSIRIL